MKNFHSLTHKHIRENANFIFNVIISLVGGTIIGKYKIKVKICYIFSRSKPLSCLGGLSCILAGNKKAKNKKAMVLKANSLKAKTSKAKNKLAKNKKAKKTNQQRI